MKKILDFLKERKYNKLRKRLEKERLEKLNEDIDRIRQEVIREYL